MKNDNQKNRELRNMRAARRNVTPVVTKATIVMTDKKKVIPRKQKHKQ